MKKEYPKFIYHKEYAAKVVKTKEEHDEHGKGWAENPFEAEAEVEAEEIVVEEKKPETKKKGK